MKPLAISVNEFGQMLRSACPPTSWGNTIAIAHSGGADSTCLLFLLNRLVSGKHNLGGIPRDLLALSVDHSLQPGSAATIERCSKFSKSLRVPHITLRIPWGRSPFPDLPVASRPYESVARAARYRVLMEAMETKEVAVIMMGHHADDHVETLLMRLARSESGDEAPTGMRSCRRWGMGTKVNGLDWVGMAGMHRWIVRPLLGIPKDRIIATCDLYGLDYVDDPTNFQPSLTPRNYVRHCLSKKDQNCTGETEDGLGLVKNLDGAIRRLDCIAGELPSLCTTVPTVGRLYAAANYLGQLRDTTDKEVTQYLRDFVRASPLSTLFLTSPSHLSPPPADIQRAIILRILRFVSPRPWGSPLSEASRRSSSLNLIAHTLWNSCLDGRKPFCAGGEVVWRPSSLREDGGVRFVIDKQNPQLNGWLASRQPPVKHTGHPSPCVRDISHLLATGEDQELLWDNRFLLKLRPRLLPSDTLSSCQASGSVIVLPHGRWFHPKIVWRRGHKALALSTFGLPPRDKSVLAGLNSSWVDIEWIRKLDAI